MSDFSRGPFDPFVIENEHRVLKHLLTTFRTSRQKLFALERFFRLLGEEPKAYESYVLEFGQFLPKIVRGLMHAGCSPEDLEGVLEAFQHVRSAVPSLGDLDGFDEALRLLQKKIAMLYGYSGDIRRAFLTIGTRGSEALVNKLLAASHTSPLALFEKARSQAKELNDECLPFLEETLTSWHPRPLHPSEISYVPVIDQGTVGSSGTRTTSAIRSVSVTIIGKPDARERELLSDTASGADARIESPFSEECLLAARDLLVETYPYVLRKNFSGKVSFGPPYVSHGGSSANLAIAALIYCEILKKTNQRRRYSILPTALISSDVQSDGSAKEIEESTLHLKVSAAFFSWASCLVVPRSQERSALSALENLNARFPLRRLSIIGISHLRELFYDRRITDQVRTGPVQHTAGILWSRKLQFGVATIIIILSLALGRQMFGPVDRNPVAGRFEGEALVVLNKRDQILDEIPVGRSTAENGIRIDLLRKFQRVAFVDVDGDGINEVIWAEARDATDAGTSTITAKSLRKDRILWTREIRGRFIFPRKADVVDDALDVASLHAGDFDLDGKPDLLAAGSHNFFPSTLMHIDPSTGEILQQYLHIGHILQVLPLDLNDDGIREILLVGISNAYRSAFLAVLDPRLVDGHSPLRGDYVTGDGSPASEICYILIPPTKVARAVQSEWRNNVATGILSSKSTRLLSIKINDTHIHVPGVSGLRPVAIDVHFSFGFEPRGVGTSDTYDFLAGDLVEAGKLKTYPDFEYFRQYQKTIQYWNGTSWQSQPSLNQSYLKKMRELNLPIPSFGILSQEKKDIPPD